MLFLSGELALLQAWILPGLAVTVRRRELALMDRLLLAVPLSAVLNFLLVETLTFLGAYTRPVLLVTVALELAAIGSALLIRRSPAVQRLGPGQASMDTATAVTAALVLVVFAQLVEVTLGHTGTVFNHGDAVNSWNRWAEDWAAGRFPRITWHYPQLVPAIMSIPYVMIGDTEIQQFSKMATAVLPVLAFCTVLRLAMYLPSYRLQIVWGLVVATALFKRLLGTSQPFDGMADFPAAYMVIASAFAFTLAWKAEQERIRRRLILLAAMVLSGALLTKQAAILPAAALLVAWIIARRQQQAPRRLISTEVAWAIGIVLVVAGHWYLYKQIQINLRLAGEHSEISSVTSVVQLSVLAKLHRAVTWASPGGAWPLVVLLVIAAHADRLGRWLFWLGVAPAFTVWALLLTYDARNFAVGITPFGICLAIGAFQVARAGRRFLTPARFDTAAGRAFAVSGAVMTLIAVPMLMERRLSRERLLASATEQKRQLGEPELNAFLYQMDSTLPEGAAIGTPYQYLGKLPDLAHRYRLVYCETLADFNSRMEGTHATHFLWLPEMCGEAVNSFILAASARGDLRSVGAVKDRVLWLLASPRRLSAPPHRAGEVTP